MKNITIIQKFPSIDYTLVKRDSTFEPFIACWHLNDDNPEDVYWSQGHYFSNVIDAAHYIEEKLAEAKVEYDEESEEEEELDDWGWDSNMPCDNTGYCAGISCSRYFQCKGGN